MKALVPDLTYSHISGGDPQEIPSLTYEQLVEFHTTYYHPSRCLFFFYGNLPLKHHLEFITDKVLKTASKVTSSTTPATTNEIYRPGCKTRLLSYHSR